MKHWINMLKPSFEALVVSVSWCAEISVLWAAHQVHHSSEEYNLTTALRQSVFQGLGGWPLYLPLALVLPPSLAVVHMELNLLYQFW